MAKFSSLTLFIIVCLTGYCQKPQKTTFDVVSFTPPQSWQQKQNDGSVQLLITDEKTGAYAMVIISKAIASTASADENFNTRWTAAIKNQIQLDGDPVMQPPSNSNGWQIVTGSAGYTDNAAKGNVTMLSATGGGQTASVIIMTNTSRYEKDLTNFLTSLELATASTTENSSSSIVGLWVYYTTETSGYSNGMPILTAGYFRREYVFNADGSYLFRVKNWSVYMKEILFIYETGTWSVNGSQLIITPSRGKGEWWSKAPSGRTSEWGSRIKAADYKLEKTAYTFEFKYLSGMKETYLILKSSSPTERDGRSGNNSDASWSYSPRALDKSLIDNPPGTSISTRSSQKSAAAEGSAPHLIFRETSPDMSVTLPAGMK